VVRLIVPILAAVLLAAATASAKTAPAYTLTFSGSGVEHQLDQQQNIQDSGLCDSAEHVDVTANLVWRTAWTGFRPAGKSALAAPSSIAGSTFSGTHVKDACGLPLDQAPPGWVAQASCSADLVPAGPASLDVQQAKTSLVVGVTAPPMAVPIGQACSINPRNDQLSAHVTVPLKKLTALKKRGSLTFKVGNAASTALDDYAPSVDCSQPTKPYEGYRTADHCRDDLSWSGTLTITRVS
jgi:hypothetical protein